MDIHSSEFGRWLIGQCRAVGWDTDDPEVARSITILAAMAITDGLTEEHTTTIARQLGVTPQEVTTAYRGEMQQAAMEELLEQPDLAALDTRLDDITRES